MSREIDKFEEHLADTLQKATDGLPDGREKAMVITKLHEALFWARAIEWLPALKQKYNK